jgi:hypothetical protein
MWARVSRAEVGRDPPALNLGFFAFFAFFAVQLEALAT